jgi:hypothetical protein
VVVEEEEEENEEDPVAEIKNPEGKKQTWIGFC